MKAAYRSFSHSAKDFSLSVKEKRQTICKNDAPEANREIEFKMLTQQFL